MRTLILAWILLVLLTFLEYLLTQSGWKYPLILWGVLLASLLKFLGVAFEYMEIKHAHSFWKTLILLIGFLFVIIMGALLS